MPPEHPCYELSLQLELCYLERGSAWRDACGAERKEFWACVERVKQRERDAALGVARGGKD